MMDKYGQLCLIKKEDRFLFYDMFHIQANFSLIWQEFNCPQLSILMSPSYR